MSILYIARRRKVGSLTSDYGKLQQVVHNNRREGRTEVLRHAHGAEGIEERQLGKTVWPDGFCQLDQQKVHHAAAKRAFANQKRNKLTVLGRFWTFKFCFAWHSHCPKWQKPSVSAKR